MNSNYITLKNLNITILNKTITIPKGTIVTFISKTEHERFNLYDYIYNDINKLKIQLCLLDAQVKKLNPEP